MNLGTERHKKQYFDAIDKFQIPGQPNSVHRITSCVQYTFSSKLVRVTRLERYLLLPACLKPFCTQSSCESYTLYIVHMRACQIQAASA